MGLSDEQMSIVRELNLSSYTVVPMTAHDRVFGAMAFASAEARRHYDQADLALAEHLAHRACLAVENALAHQEIEREKAKLESIVASVTYGVMHVDRKGRITYANPSAAVLLKGSGTGLRGLDACAVVHGPDCSRSICCVRSALRGKAHDGRDEFQLVNGETIPVELLESPIEIRNQLDGAVLVFHDIRERLEQERARDDFVAYTSHELRSPLTPVIGLANWFSRRSETEPQHYDEDDRLAIETLRDETSRLSRVVETFLDLSRIEAGQFGLDEEPTDLKSAVQAEVDNLVQRSPGVPVTVQMPEEKVHALSDELRFRQVLANLLDNAVKYGGDPARVEVSLTRDSASIASIVVTDNGRGIPESDRSRIFSRFYRGSGEEVQRKKGLGIGLYITKQIVEAAGGSISASSNPGGGSMFRVQWPLIRSRPDSK